MNIRMFCEYFSCRAISKRMLNYHYLRPPHHSDQEVNMFSFKKTWKPSKAVFPSPWFRERWYKELTKSFWFLHKWMASHISIHTHSSMARIVFGRWSSTNDLVTQGKCVWWSLKLTSNHSSIVYLRYIRVTFSIMVIIIIIIIITIITRMCCQ